LKRGIEAILKSDIPGVITVRTGNVWKNCLLCLVIKEWDNVKKFGFKETVAKDVVCPAIC